MRFLITAGPTREPIDPVRFLSNRSSGRMGYALAEAALEQGHEVALVSGPVAIPAPAGVSPRVVETAQEMYDAVATVCAAFRPDVAILSAAVADHRPRSVSRRKIKKGDDRWTLELERCPDVLGSMREKMGFGGFLVGFAAETENLVANAMEKLRRKGCDLVIANEVGVEGRGFDSEDNEVVVCHPSGRAELIERQPKRDLACRMIGLIAELARAKGVDSRGATPANPR